MAWIDAPRSRGVRPVPQTASMSLGWRKPTSRKSPVACCNFSKELVRELGWTVGARIKVMHGTGEHLGMTRLTVSDDPFCYAFQVKRGFGTLLFPLERVQSEQRQAAAVKFRIEGDAVIIIRPDWAAPERVFAGMDGARAAMEAARARAGIPHRAPAGIMERVADPGIGRRIG